MKIRQPSSLRFFVYLPLFLYGLFWGGYYVLSFNHPYHSLELKYLLAGGLYIFAGFLAYLPFRKRNAIPANWSDRKIVWVCVFLCALIFIPFAMQPSPTMILNRFWEDGLPLSLLAISFVTAMNMRLEQRKGYVAVFGVIFLSILIILSLIAYAVISILGSLP